MFKFLCFLTFVLFSSSVFPADELPDHENRPVVRLNFGFFDRGLLKEFSSPLSKVSVDAVCLLGLSFNIERYPFLGVLVSAPMTISILQNFTDIYLRNEDLSPSAYFSTLLKCHSVLTYSQLVLFGTQPTAINFTAIPYLAVFSGVLNVIYESATSLIEDSLAGPPPFLY